MEPTDLTVKILQELREGQKAQTQELRGELHSLRDELRESRAHADQRFEVIETTLRDLAERLTIMGRAIKVALESRS